MVLNSVPFMLKQLVIIFCACETPLVVKKAGFAEKSLERSTGDLRESLDRFISSLGRGVGPNGLQVRCVKVPGVVRVRDGAPKKVCRLDLIAVGVCATRDSTLVRGLAR